MVEPAHQLGLSSRLGTDGIFLNLFQALIGDILSAVGDVLVDSEVPVLTLSISRICWLSLWKMLIKVELCACIYRGKSVCV